MRQTPAGDVDYEAVGAGYSAARVADPRIAARVHAALGDARTVLNVGAGTGNYEPADRYVVAVEPSARMRSQRALPAVDAVAENLPFDDDSFDAVMAMSTVHQWPDPERGLAELRRVSRGPVVVLCFCPVAIQAYWLGEYLPEMVAAENHRYRTPEWIASELGGTVEHVPHPLDCTDGHVEAFYGRPEAYLDPAVRRAQSVWTFVSPSVIEAGLVRLRADLESGAWDERFGYLRTQPSYDGSLRLVTNP